MDPNYGIKRECDHEVCTKSTGGYTNLGGLWLPGVYKCVRVWYYTESTTTTNTIPVILYKLKHGWKVGCGRVYSNDGKCKAEYCNVGGTHI